MYKGYLWCKFVCKLFLGECLRLWENVGGPYFLCFIAFLRPRFWNVLVGFIRCPPPPCSSMSLWLFKQWHYTQEINIETFKSQNSFHSKYFIFIFKGLRFELGPWPEDDDFCRQLEREERERDARRLHPQSGRITAGCEIHFDFNWIHFAFSKITLFEFGTK